MKKQLNGIALILLGIIFAIPYTYFAGYSWFIGFFLGIIGLIIVIVNSKGAD